MAVGLLVYCLDGLRAGVVGGGIVGPGGSCGVLVEPWAGCVVGPVMVLIGVGGVVVGTGDVVGS